MLIYRIFNEINQIIVVFNLGNFFVFLQMTVALLAFVVRLVTTR